MTLHTRVRITSPGVDPLAAFTLTADLLGATPEHRWHHQLSPGEPGDIGFELGQGLPAWMWVEYGPDETALPIDPEWQTTDPAAAEASDGDLSFVPAGYVEIHFDTAYGYRGPGGAGCGDLHAWLVRELGAWLAQAGATWCWYDESGDGWMPDLSSYGALGDPDRGALRPTGH